MVKNILEPAKESAKAIKVLEKEIKTLQDNIKKSSKTKQKEAQEIVKDDTIDLQEKKPSLQNLLDRKTPEQRVSELKDELISFSSSKCQIS